MTFAKLVAAASLATSFVLFGGTAHSQQLQDLPKEKAATERTTVRAAPKATKDDVYISTLGGKIFQLNVKTGRLSQIVSSSLSFTDVAVCPNRQVYATTFYNLYRIDVKRGTVTNVGSHDVYNMNALVCGKGNVLFGHSPGNSELVQINRNTAQAIVIGRTGTLRSSGDLEFIGNRLYLSTTNKRLARINPANGTVISRVTMGSAYVYGLAALGNQMYAFIGDEVFKVNTKTGKRTRIMDLGSTVGTISGASAAIVK